MEAPSPRHTRTRQTSTSRLPIRRYFEDPDTIGVRGSTNPDPRLGVKELVIGLEHENRFAAVPLIVTRIATFVARAGDRELTFESAGHALRDRETESLWSLDTGEAVDGPLKGQRLQRVSSQDRLLGDLGEIP